MMIANRQVVVAIPPERRDFISLTHEIEKVKRAGYVIEQILDLDCAGIVIIGGIAHRPHGSDEQSWKPNNAPSKFMDVDNCARCGNNHHLELLFIEEAARAYRDRMQENIHD
ncbi:MAG: hypothetical protein HS115_11625 [Spirochaetales bacterium]|nr:hypothetical protein [Spirochaetales bacterium]